MVEYFQDVGCWSGTVTRNALGMCRMFIPSTTHTWYSTPHTHTHGTVLLTHTHGTVLLTHTHMVQYSSHTHMVQYSSHTHIHAMVEYFQDVGCWSGTVTRNALGMCRMFIPSTTHTWYSTPHTHTHGTVLLTHTHGTVLLTHTHTCMQTQAHTH